MTRLEDPAGLVADPMTPADGPGPRQRRVLQVIARLNVGGPAHHVSILAGRLDPSRYRTILVHGRIGPGEASFATLARDQGATLYEIPRLGREINPVADLPALLALIGLIRRFHPDIVHTHTAKAGMLGRLAAVMAGTRRPVIVHTYHGHVLEGYFGAATSRVYRKLERGLAQVSDCLVGVSRATVDDLVRLDIAPRSRFRTIAIGLDLERLATVDSAAGPAFRREIGAGPDEVLLTCVSRLVPIKRIDVLLRAVAEVRSRGIGVKLAIVGDGPARPELERLSADLGLAEAVRFTGYLLDVRPVLAATDIAVLSSDSEGTPVSLIEAAAVGRPAVATAVGGVADVVHSDCGLLVEAGNPEALASALERLARDAALRAIMGARAREHVLDRFSSRRVLADTDRLYGDLMWERAAGVMG